MFLQPINSGHYESIQQLQTKVAIMRAKLKLLRLDDPDRDVLVAEFATLQGRLTLARQGVERFGSPGFTC